MFHSIPILPDGMLIRKSCFLANKQSNGEAEVLHIRHMFLGVKFLLEKYHIRNFGTK
jgi:hypothetical protein